MPFAHTESALVLIGIFVYLCTKLVDRQRYDFKPMGVGLIES